VSDLTDSKVLIARDRTLTRFAQSLRQHDTNLPLFGSTALYNQPASLKFFKSFPVFK
jgi:hypothetical protein